MREKIYRVIEVNYDEESSHLANCYDWFMMTMIILSIVPLAFRAHYAVFNIIERIALVVFVIDYILRLMTADIKYRETSVKHPFLRYPISPMAIIDLISILPSLVHLRAGLKLLNLIRAFRILRLVRTFRVFRVFKALRYSKNVHLLGKVLREAKSNLGTVCFLAIGYVLIVALVIFNVEPRNFDNYYQAVYWAIISLTTVGYGDIYPVTNAGYAVTMISSVVGIAVVALPAGIITAGYMKALEGEHHAEHDDELKQVEVIREYKKLLDEGAITAEEYEFKKKQLLGMEEK